MSRPVLVVVLCVIFLFQLVAVTDVEASSSLTVSGNAPSVAMATVLAQSSYGNSDQDSSSSSGRSGRGIFRLGKLVIVGIIGGVYWLVKWSLFDD